MLYKPLHRNISVLCFVYFTTGLVFFYPILALYLQEQLFTVFNVTVIYSIITFGSAVLEIPTGIFSDLIGRKKTLMLARTIDVIAVVLLAFGTEFYHFALYAVSVACTSALSSGNDDAFVYDSLSAVGRTDMYKKISGMLGMCMTIAAGLASLIGGFIAAYSLRLPALFTIIPFTLSAVATFFLVEPPVREESKKNVRTHLKTSAAYFISNSSFALISLSFVLFSFIAEPIFQVLQIFYTENKISVTYFGVIYGMSMGLYSLGSYFSHDISKKLGDRNTLLMSILLLLILTYAATFLPGWPAACLMTCMGFIFGLNSPVFSHMMNAEIDSSQRATVLSMANFACAIGLTVLVPCMGFLVDHSNIRIAYRIFSSFYLLLFILLMCIKQKKS